MKVDVVMPQMGESITEGTIAKWLKKPGDKIERDESILEITTDKIDSEIPSPESGILSEILAEEGETIEVGAVLARIDTEGEEGQAEPVGKEGKPEKKEEKKAKPSTEEPEPEEEEGAEEEEEEEEEEKEEELAISPVARNVAKEHGLSKDQLSRIQGTGSGGRITKSDVLQFIEGQEVEETAPPEKKEEKAPAQRLEIPRMKFGYDADRVEIIEMNAMRKTIAEHMVYSKHVSPHTYNAAEVDMTRIVQFRERVKRQFEREEEFKLTYTPFILHAAVQALKSYPLMNSSVEENRIVRKEYINLGVAVAIEDGLLVPVIKDADEKSLLGLARASWELAEKARQKKLKPDDVQGGTFTVTNPGVFGNIFGFPIINQPQVGILGVGAVKKRPVVIDDAIAIRSIMYITLSYDHRVIDGALAARFIQTIRENLETYEVDKAL